MCFGGGGGGGQIDSGAAEAARMQAETARENAAREDARWQREQAKQEADKKAQADEAARQEQERSKQLSDAQTAQRAQIAAQGATGVGADISSVQSKQKQALAGYDSAFKDLKGKEQAQAQANAGQDYLGQSNTLVAKSGFNQANTGGKRYYSV